jgi:hypothetical protein
MKGAVPARTAPFVFRRRPRDAVHEPRPGDAPDVSAGRRRPSAGRDARYAEVGVTVEVYMWTPPDETRGSLIGEGA